MLPGNRCVRCGQVVRGPRAEHRQTKYCERCARDKKRENTESPMLPGEKRRYMRKYMRKYRRAHPGLSTPYVRRHRERKREARAQSSGGREPAVPAGALRCHAAATVVVVLLLLFKDAAPEGRGVGFEEVSAFIVRLQLLVVEVAGLAFIALLCWHHLSDFWRNRKK